ncbi:MAG: ABC transporter ATP-binding protein [Chloroflexota bacterium]
MLRLEALEAGYGESPVLHAVDLEIPEGQLLCVLGPSGGGKSTLLRVIAGLEPPTAGSVSLAGLDLVAVPPHERGIGLMFQDYALFPHRDVGDNVAFGLRMRGTSAATMRTRVSELLELVGMRGTERRAVAQLSGGEQQRVALARALAPRPRLLMLDEPMGSLDRSLRERLPEELRSIFTELKLTVIYVTHDQDEALSVADRVVLLHAGRIVADGSPEELWTRPPTAWTARFLGFRNVAPARLTGSRLHTPWGQLAIGASLTHTAAGPRRAADGDVVVVLRPAGLVPEVDGPIKGVVEERRFRGDHVLLSVAVGDAPTLFVEAREGLPAAVGDSIALGLREGAAHIIPES